MNHYKIELLDTQEHVFFSTVSLADNSTSALDLAKEKAYHQMDKHNIVIRYVSVKNEDEHLVYNLLTKETDKWY